MRLFFASLLLLSLLANTPSYAAYDEYSAVEEGGGTDLAVNDPIEPFNRAVFAFNGYVDTLVLKPVTKVYTTITPDFVQTGVSNFLANLSSPVVLLNNMLQGDIHGAGHTLKRFAANTTWGLGGLIDVGTRLGIEPANADFGQTLGKWGVGQGPYLVLPIFGPSSVRDGTGRVVDTVTDPYNLYFSAGDHPEWPLYARAGLAAVDARARYGAEIDNVTKTAVDPYSTFRSIYLQRRAYFVQGKTVDSNTATITTPRRASKKTTKK